MLAETAHNAGVITNEEFAIFQNAGYMGLYGGLDVDDIHTKKQLEVGQKILDYMGSTELIANLFRISQTEEKLRKDKIVGAENRDNVRGTSSSGKPPSGRRSTSHPPSVTGWCRRRRC